MSGEKVKCSAVVVTGRNAEETNDMRLRWYILVAAVSGSIGFFAPGWFVAVWVAFLVVALIVAVRRYNTCDKNEG